MHNQHSALRMLIVHTRPFRRKSSRIIHDLAVGIRPETDGEFRRANNAVDSTTSATTPSKAYVPSNSRISFAKILAFAPRRCGAVLENENARFVKRSIGVNLRSRTEIRSIWLKGEARRIASDV